uniref:Uncharacterized protein n=1 Tax=Panagrolaimus davidi TaxID=227884 RepID=A0A914QKP1_9BILA
MNIIHLTLFIFVNFNIAYCSLEVTLGTFITSAISSNDFIKNVNTAFYWSKNIYRLIKDIKSVGGEAKPNLNIITKELSDLDKNMQTSLKGIKEVLMDHHFQTHIELPTFALYRHVTTYISNPTTISESELIEACSKRYSPNDILSNLSLLLQKQWLLNKLKETYYDKDTVADSEIFIENLIKQLIISQSFCIELRYGSNTADNKSYRILTIKFVEEIRSLIMKQVKTLKVSIL